MNHTSKTTQCLVALKWTILDASKLILLLLMWPFPQPQFKSARKGEGWEFRSNCKRSQGLSVTNMVGGRSRSSNCCSTLTWHPMAQDAGSFPWACSHPNPVGDMPNRAPDGSHFEEKGGKDSKQQLTLFREKKKEKKVHYEGGHQLENARQAGWVQGMARRDVEKSSWNVNFLLYSSEVLLEAWTKRLRKSQTCRTCRQEPGKPIKKKHWKDKRQVKRSCQYNMRGKVWVIQTRRIRIASQVQIDTPPHQHRRH